METKITEKGEEEVYRASCLCCRTRFCLLFWTVLGILFCLALLTFQVYYDASYFGGMSKTISYAITILDLFAFIFALVSVLLKRRRWLIIGFWIGIFIIIYFCVSFVIDPLFILGVLGHFPKEDTRETIITLVISAIYDWIFIWVETIFCQSVHYYIKELKEEQRFGLQSV